MRSMQISAAILGACAAMTGSANAGPGSFTPGDLYLVSPALPAPGGTFTPGIAHIDPVTWAVTELPLDQKLPSLGRASYDASRNRLIASDLGALYLVGADGSLTSLPYTGSQTVQITAPAGDGRIYMFRDGPDTFAYLDQAGQTHDLLDQTGTAPYFRLFVTAMIYDSGTNSLFIGEASGPDILFIKLQLNPKGSQVIAETIWLFDTGTFLEQAVGMNRGPGGTIFVKIDDSSNQAAPRMVLIDPVTTQTTTYATSEYFGVAAEVAGCYSSVLDRAVVLDSLNDVLRTFGAGDVGAGTIVATSGVSPPGSTGEISVLVEVAGAVACPADLASPPGLDFFDLLSFLSLFTAMDPGADLAPPLGQWDFFDILAYLTLFDAGCP